MKHATKMQYWHAIACRSPYTHVHTQHEVTGQRICWIDGRDQQVAAMMTETYTCAGQDVTSKYYIGDDRP